MASDQDSDVQNHIQNALMDVTASNDAQAGIEGSSRTRYSRKAKKDATEVGKVVEDKEDTKKAAKGKRSSL